jgi:hypothetical protein
LAAALDASRDGYPLADRRRKGVPFMRRSLTGTGAVDESQPADAAASASSRGEPPALWVFVVVGAGLVVVLASGRLFSGSETALVLRVAAATMAVLVFPGALVLRVVDGQLPRGVRLGGAVAWSLALIFVAQTLAVLVHGSLVTTMATLGVCVAALMAVLWLRSGLGSRSRAVWAPGKVPRAIRDSWALLATAATGILLGGFVAWARPAITGDALEHLARTRKLAELTSFDRVGMTEFFRDADLHPGYAFPLWHAAMALVARLAGVDSAVVIQLAPVVITPIALVIVFGMGATVFSSRAAGFCTAIGQVALFGLAAGGIGAFAIISGPATVSLVALAPALIALVFAFVDGQRRSRLLTVGAAALALTVIHPTYTIYVVMILLAFCVARSLLSADMGDEVRRTLLGVAATAVAAGLYLAWLAPQIARQPSVGADQSEVDRQLEVYANQVHRSGDLYAMVPEAITRMGPGAVLGLVGVALALLAARRRWGALVLAGAGVVLLVTLFAPLFTVTSDLVSISQARRLVSFLPFALAFAGLAMVVARLRAIGVGLALLAGVVATWRYPGDFTYSMSQGGGPAWPTWLGLASVATAAAILPWWRRRKDPDLAGSGLADTTGAWAALVAVALIAPLAVTGLSDVSRNDRDRSRFSRALLHELRTDVPTGSVVFADDAAAYEAVAFAPVYVNTAVGGHVWDRRVERHDDAVRFFRSGTDAGTRLQLLEKYQADYVLARVAQAESNNLDGILTRVFEDARFVLYAVPRG